MPEDKISDSLKKRLRIKKVKGKQYLYLREKTLSGTKDYYVCAYPANEKEMKNALDLTFVKVLIDALTHLFQETKKRLKADCIDDKDFLDLEMVRLGYNLFLKDLDDNDLKKYEQVMYTAYVFGTTSIEGNTYNLVETEMTLNKGLTVTGKTPREFYEIENYSKLKEYLEIKKDVYVSLELMKEIHKIIMRNIDDNSAGEFRRIMVGLRGSEYVPRPPFEVQPALEGLLKWYNENKDKIHPIELIAKFHQKFEEIHPFNDGNGRVGREIMRVMLHNFQFPSVFIGPKNREAYLKSLVAGNQRDYKPLVKFLVTNLLECNDNLLKKAADKLSKMQIENNPDFNKKNKKILEDFINRINNIKMRKTEEKDDIYGI